MNRSWILAARRAAGLVLAASLAGCSGGVASPAPSASATVAASDHATAAASPALSASPATPASVSPSATAAPATAEPPLPAAPPVAVLTGLAAGAEAKGSLGTYTWGGGGSDAPWVVAKRAGTASAGSKLEVVFGGLEPASWTSAWARVQGGTASSPAGGVSGEGRPAVSAPAAGGDWSLRVTATFSPGSNATYYWRLTVTP